MAPNRSRRGRVPSTDLAVILLERDPQPVRQAVDEVEVGRHLDDLEDAPVVQTGLPQGDVVLPPDPVRLDRELLGESQDGVEALIQIGLSPVPGERTDEFLVLRDQTERRPVMLDSVPAPVDRGDHDGDGLALGA